MEPIYVALTEEHFRALVAGRIVSATAIGVNRGQPVKIMLSDIGWSAMVRAVQDAMVAGETHDWTKPPSAGC